MRQVQCSPRIPYTSRYDFMHSSQWTRKKYPSDGQKTFRISPCERDNLITTIDSEVVYCVQHCSFKIFYRSTKYSCFSIFFKSCDKLFFIFFFILVHMFVCARNLIQLICWNLIHNGIMWQKIISNRQSRYEYLI